MVPCQYGGIGYLGFQNRRCVSHPNLGVGSRTEGYKYGESLLPFILTVFTFNI